MEIPFGIRLMLSFFLEAVRREPLRIPQGVPKVGGETFRVDVKAEGSTVVIWANGRWFSVRLTRRNAPWVFVKGELFKVIASLELLATTVVIMVFGPDVSGGSRKACAHRIHG